MYLPKEIELSKLYLEKIFRDFKGNICLIGGWAVYQLVNNNYHRVTGREYIGSKDIDVGFHIQKKWTKCELIKSDFSKFINYLKEMNFIWQAFRLFKDYDFETMEELTLEESKKRPPFNIVRIYIDPIIDNIHPLFNHVFGYDPIDEPLLTLIFEEDLYEEHTIFGINIKIPQTHIILGMKLNSVTKRDKEDKIIKDISDIYSLMWFSDLEFKDLKIKLYDFYSKVIVEKILTNFEEEQIIKVSESLGVESSEIKKIFTEFMK